MYVHVPFCLTRCHYRDFVTYTGMEAAAAATRPRWERGGHGGGRPSARRRRGHQRVRGGGTLTLLPPGDLARVLARLRELLAFAPGAEVTVEANPETVDRPWPRGWPGPG